MSADASKSCYPTLEKNMSLWCRLCWTDIDDSSVPEWQQHYGAYVWEESEENPRASSSSWTTSKNLSLWPSKGKSRNPMNATVKKSRNRRRTLCHPSELSLGSNATESEKLAYKHGRCTLAVWRSQRRELECQLILERTVGNLEEQVDKWKTICTILQEIWKRHTVAIHPTSAIDLDLFSLPFPPHVYDIFGDLVTLR
ncbi:hypothetical protein F5877DRAFT_85201 [Lentinula edodes]|nr:hypothetical protein F5877DRAFT_85201 [Lentinula edodes]